MTLDGYCDHTVAIADDEIHDHYTELLKRAGTLIYGRVTYQLMESFWPGLVRNPSSDRDLDEFAVAIDKIPKIVFSNTLKDAPWGKWNNAEIIHGDAVIEIKRLKTLPGKHMVMWGSISLAQSLMKENLIDEYHLQFCPVLTGGGRNLFTGEIAQKNLQLLEVRHYNTGTVFLNYKPR